MRKCLLLAAYFSVLAFGCSDDEPTGPPPKVPPLHVTTFQAASLVIGQFDMLDGRADAGMDTIGPYGFTSLVGAPSPAPAALQAQATLYVVDQGHSRILGYNKIPTGNGRAASFVIGQDDFYTDDYGHSASKFTIPNRCYAAHGRLYLSDYGTSRVLIWNSLPTENQPADVVVGQDNFENSVFVVDASHIAQPSGVMEVGGKLYVADATHARLLIYNSIPEENGAAADVVVGQPDFTTSTSGSGAAGIGEPYGFWTDGHRLVVADGFLDRVMIWNTVPTSNGVAADIVVGAPDFDTAGSNTPSATSIGKPWGVASDGNILFVADYTFNRVLVYDPFPTANNPPATYVIGQSNFSNATANDDDQDGMVDSFPSGRTLFQPADVSVIGGRLFVADQGNNRCLIYESQ